MKLIRYLDSLLKTGSIDVCIVHFWKKNRVDVAGVGRRRRPELSSGVCVLARVL